MTIIRMKRDYYASYKYAPLLKDNRYDVAKLPKDVQAKVAGLIKGGYAIEVDSGNLNVVNVNSRSILLEQRQQEKDTSEVATLARQELARQQMKVQEPIKLPIAEPIIEEEAPKQRGRRKNLEE